MQTSIYAQNINPYSTTSEINFSLELPTKCPCCGTTYSRIPEYSNFFENSSGTITANSTYFCPTCGNCFFIVYSVEKLHHDLFGFPLVQYPTPSETTSFSKEISMLTPKFIEIYQQAEKAENSGLTELCGIGYRKALEFLVKDYAISNHPNSKEQIESFMLGKANYVDMILQSKSLVTITQIAKDYGMSGRKLNKILKELKIQYKVGGQWVLYSKYQNGGYVHSRTIDITRTDGRADVAMQTEWTQKGRLFLYEELKKRGYVPVIEQAV